MLSILRPLPPERAEQHNRGRGRGGRFSTFATNNVRTYMACIPMFFIHFGKSLERTNRHRKLLK